MRTHHTSDQCPSCGYMRVVSSQYVDDVVRYKSGKRKGEIKEVAEKEVSFEIGHADFQHIELLSDISSSFEGLHKKRYNVKVCPECNTMIFNDTAEESDW